MDLNGVVKIADDLLVYGTDDDEHDRNLVALLEKCHEVGLTLNPNKLKFKCKNVPFFGNVVTDEGINSDPLKVQAIKNWPVPTCLKELQSFLGAVNLTSSFHNYLNCAYPCKAYVRKGYRLQMV